VTTLPSGWIRAPLGSLVDVLDHRRVPVNAEERARRPGVIPYYGATGQVGWIDDHLFDEELVLLGEDGAPFLDPSKPKAYVVSGRSWVNNHAHVLRGREVSNRLLAHQLNVLDFHGAVSGTTRLKLPQGPMRSLMLVVPPRAEQDRIVAAIEQHLSDIDAGVASLERVQANLKRYRASVLKAACEGKLVSTEAELARKEGRAYESGAELLKRILVERRARWEADELAKMKAKGKVPAGDAWKKKYVEPTPPQTKELPALPEGWCWTTVDALLASIETGASFKCDERPPTEDEIGVVKVSAVSWGEYDEGQSKTCRDPDRIDPSLFIKPGDFLFSRANTIELVGACVIARHVVSRVMLSDKILRFDVLGEAAWLLWCLRSQHGRDEIERLATGNQDSMRNIGQERIRQIRVPLPPQAEAVRICAEITRLMAAADDAEQQVARQLARAARLRQAVLRDAFEGKLVSTDEAVRPAVHAAAVPTPHEHPPASALAGRASEVGALPVNSIGAAVELVGPATLRRRAALSDEQLAALRRMRDDLGASDKMKLAAAIAAACPGMRLPQARSLVTALRDLTMAPEMDVPVMMAARERQP
jgi:type I restriction enzyme S subunit